MLIGLDPQCRSYIGVYIALYSSGKIALLLMCLDLQCRRVTVQYERRHLFVAFGDTAGARFFPSLTHRRFFCCRCCTTAADSPAPSSNWCVCACVCLTCLSVYPRAVCVAHTVWPAPTCTICAVSGVAIPVSAIIPTDTFFQRIHCYNGYIIPTDVRTNKR